MVRIHSYVQPAISSNRLGIETHFQLSPDIPVDEHREILVAIGHTIPDYRFWIPSYPEAVQETESAMIRSIERSHTVLLGARDSTVRRIDMLQLCLSLGLTLNTMYIPQLWIPHGVCVSVACQSEPFNFHPRLLKDGNQVDGCLVTFTYGDASPNSSVEMMIISVICRMCGFARL